MTKNLVEERYSVVVCDASKVESITAADYKKQNNENINQGRRTGNAGALEN